MAQAGAMPQRISDLNNGISNSFRQFAYVSFATEMAELCLDPLTESVH